MSARLDPRCGHIHDDNSVEFCACGHVHECDCPECECSGWRCSGLAVMTDAEAITLACGLPGRLWLRQGEGPEREVTVAEWCTAEADAGFRPQGAGPMATAGFAKGDSDSDSVQGRIEPPVILG